MSDPHGGSLIQELQKCQAELSRVKAELERKIDLGKATQEMLIAACESRDAWKLKYENQLKHCSEADLELHHAKLKAERLAEALEEDYEPGRFRESR